MKKIIVILMIAFALTSCENVLIEPEIVVIEKDKPDAVSLTIGNTTTDAVRVR